MNELRMECESDSYCFFYCSENTALKGTSFRSESPISDWTMDTSRRSSGQSMKACRHGSREFSLELGMQRTDLRPGQTGDSSPEKHSGASTHWIRDNRAPSLAEEPETKGQGNERGRGGERGVYREEEDEDHGHHGASQHQPLQCHNT